VTGNTQLSGGVTYMYSDSLAVDVPLALPFKHKIIGAGSVSGVGQLGEVSALPATVFLQYRFNEANAKVRPYIGLGLTYAHFFGETGSGKLTALTNPGGSPTRFSVQSKWRLTPQIGAIVNLDSKWFIDMHVSKTNLSTTTTFSTGQHMNMALDPVTYGIEFGVKF
jgi:outer membrane protein